MKTTLNNLLYIIPFLLVLSCSRDNLDPGVLNNKGKIEVSVIDTFNIISYSIEPDSLITSDWDTISVGNYLDPYFGKFYGAFVGQVKLPNSEFRLSEDSVAMRLDSITIEYNVISFYGDTVNVIPQRFNVLRLSNDLDPSIPYFGTEAYEIKSTFGIVGSATINPKTALHNRKFSIRLDSSFSNDFFKTLIGKSFIEDQEQLNDILGAFMLAPDTQIVGNGVFIVKPYSAMSGFKIHYTNISGTSEEALYSYFNFDKFDLAAYSIYQHSQNDRIRNYYTNLDTSIGSDTVFMQGHYGQNLMIRLPKKVQELDNIALLSAELLIPIYKLEEPKYNSIDSNFSIDSNIRTNNLAYENILSQLFFKSTTTSETINGIEQNYYSINITKYIYAYRNETIDITKGIELFINPKYPNRVILGGNDNIKLKLTVTE